MEYLEAVRDVFLEGWSNVAAVTNGGRATASSTYNDNYPERAVIDGEQAGTAWGKGGGWNDDTENLQPDWIQVDFNGPKSIGKIDVFTLHDAWSGLPGVPTNKPMGISLRTEFSRAGITDFKVRYWDGAAWKTVPGGEVTGNRKAHRQFVFKPLVTAKIRLDITGAMEGYSRVAEFEAWGRDPIPGCTNRAYAEFDSAAETDDGSCVTVSMHPSSRPSQPSANPSMPDASLRGALVLRGPDLDVPHGAAATLVLHDLQGNTVLLMSSQAAGAFRIPRSGLHTGVYWLRLEAGKAGGKTGGTLRRLLVL
jgi:hypothetical protein